MAKSRLTKKQLPLLKSDLELDDSVVKELSAVQLKYRNNFKEKIEATEAESLKRYVAKVESLKAAKAKMLAEFNAEIKKYEALVKARDKSGLEAKKRSTTKKRTTRKTRTKKTPPN